MQSHIKAIDSENQMIGEKSAHFFCRKTRLEQRDRLLLSHAIIMNKKKKPDDSGFSTPSHSLSWCALSFGIAANVQQNAKCREHEGEGRPSIT